MHRNRQIKRRRKLEDEFTTDFDSFDRLRNQTVASSTPSPAVNDRASPPRQPTNPSGHGSTARRVSSHGAGSHSSWHSPGQGFSRQRDDLDTQRSKARPVSLLKVKDRQSSSSDQKEGLTQSTNPRPVLPGSDVISSQEALAGEDCISWNNSDSGEEDMETVVCPWATVDRCGVVPESDEDAVIADSDSDSSHSPCLVPRTAGGGERGTPQQEAYHSPDPPTGPSPAALPQVPSSPSISSMSSAGVSPLGSPSRSGVKASSWAGRLQWQVTPKKEEDGAQLPAEASADSTKKKRKTKYASGTFAGQLWRRMCREKSSIRMRNWSQAEEEGGGRHCVLQVLEMSAVCGVTWTRCLMLSACPDSQTSSQEAGPSLEGERSQVVLFSQPLAHSLKIGRGSVVKLRPPWQELSAAVRGQPLILCSQHAHLLQATEFPPLSPLPSTPAVSLAAEWRCPCSRDSSMAAFSCPAEQSPFSPSACLQQSACRQVEGEVRALHTVAGSRRTAAREACVSVSILESVESCAALGRPLSFTALVQRSFSAALMSSTALDDDRWTHLVEDTQGTVAVVAVGGSQATAVKEGNLYCFSGLSVRSRQTRDRHPQLFSIVDQLWRGRQSGQTETSTRPADSQEADIHSGQSSCGGGQVPRPPDFCYALGVEESETLQVTAVERQLSSPVYRPPASPLPAPLDLPSFRHSRVSVQACLMYVFHPIQAAAATDTGSSPASPLPPPPQALQPSQAWLFLLHEGVQGEEGSVDPQAWLRVQVGRGCEGALEGLSGPLVALTEAYCLQDCLLLDQFARLEGRVVSSQTACREPHPLRPPPLSPHHPTPCLASVSGDIQGVDEAAAFSWEECEHCGSDKIATRADSELVCLGCRRQVSAPITRVRMVALLKPDIDGASPTVRLDLLETTIKSLLPEEGDEEGYDVSCVLGRRLENLSCLVHGITGQKVTAEEVVLEPDK